MCHACVIEGVRKSMLSRRDLFRGAAAVGLASAAAGMGSASAALAQASGTVVDLTHAYDGTFPTFGSKPGFTPSPSPDLERNPCSTVHRTGAVTHSFHG